jgi:hypothetical protein
MWRRGGSMAEHRQRVSAATHATTLGELWSLVTDLQATNPVQPFATQPSKLPRGPVVIAAVTGVVIVICAAIALALMSNGSSTTDIPTASASAEAPETYVLAAEPSTTAEEPAPVPEDPPPVVLSPPQELHTAAGMADVIDELRKRFGDTMGYELAITPDQAILARPDPTNAAAAALAAAPETLRIAPPTSRRPSSTSITSPSHPGRERWNCW